MRRRRRRHRARQQGGDTITGGAGDDDLIGGHNVAGGHDAGDHRRRRRQRRRRRRQRDVLRGDSASPRSGLTGSDDLRRRRQPSTANIGTAPDQPDRRADARDHAVRPRHRARGSCSATTHRRRRRRRRALRPARQRHDPGRRLRPRPTSARRREHAPAPSSAATDGDDYIEGNGGNDLIFGNLGQDDLIGGSSDLFSLTTPAQRPDGADIIFGGAGTALGARTTRATTRGGHAARRRHDPRRQRRHLPPRRRAAQLPPVHLRHLRTALALDHPAGRRAARLQPDRRRRLHLDEPDDQAVSTLASPARTRTSAAATSSTARPATTRSTARPATTALRRRPGRRPLRRVRHDWISGGTGDDGILGDDGLLLTSRNGVAEPLYGLAATTQIVALAPGDKQTTTIYSNLALRKQADLEPFYIGNNDVIYGGLGNDFLHGGAGDDAMSGAEALRVLLHGRPARDAGRALGVLRGRQRAPARVPPGAARGVPLVQRERPVAQDHGRPERSTSCSTSAGGTTAAPVDDGQDVLFGDTGHDWLVGGTNHDRLYGGYGDDLLQGDDNLDSTAGTADPLRNDIPDTRATAPVFADIGFGGAGYDVIIVNTAVDRMYDWNGEFNSYFAPFNPYGEPTVSRLTSPATVQYLYDLSRSDGADRTRPGDAARNGEPFGEIGLVTQSDADWGAQQGSPRDPQPGGRPNKRDAVSIGNVGVRTPGPAPMTLDPGSETPAADPATLDAPTLALLVESGKAYWTTTLGAGDPRLALFDGLTVALDDLPGLTLGVTEGTTITIDADGAGYGWFADGVEELDGRVDAMTVVEHELGHALGFEHEDAIEHEVMRETITLIVPPSTPDLTTDTGFSATTTSRTTTRPRLPAPRSLGSS